jgi:hypothetical protein
MKRDCSGKAVARPKRGQGTGFSVGWGGKEKGKRGAGGVTE